MSKESLPFDGCKTCYLQTVADVEVIIGLSVRAGKVVLLCLLPSSLSTIDICIVEATSRLMWLNKNMLFRYMRAYMKNSKASRLHILYQSNFQLVDNI